MLEGRKKVLFCRVDPEFHEKIKIEANKNKIKMKSFNLLILLMKKRLQLIQEVVLQ